MTPDHHSGQNARATEAVPAECALVVAAGAGLAALGLVAWSASGGAIYLDMLLAGLATCF